MSQENVEAFRNVIKAINERGPDSALERPRDGAVPAPNAVNFCCRNPGP